MTTSPGTKIRELRILAEMSQEELGKRVGVQRAAINKYEVGTVQNIPIKTIEKIAQVFDVSPTYIVGWNGDESNPLSAEVKILQGIKKFYGIEGVDILEKYTNLSCVGQRRVRQYINDMYQIYEKEEPEVNRNKM